MWVKPENPKHGMLGGKPPNPERLKIPSTSSCKSLTLFCSGCDK